jgi:hypothetical protein
VLEVRTSGHQFWSRGVIRRAKRFDPSGIGFSVVKKMKKESIIAAWIIVLENSGIKRNVTLDQYGRILSISTVRST